MIDLPELPSDSIVIVDTETSGLFVDDGARVATVQLGWFDDGKLHTHPQYRFPGEVRADRSTTIEPFPFGPDAPIRKAIYAFDQGLETPLGPKTDLPHQVLKGKYRIQSSLFDSESAPNLPPHDFIELMDWLTQHRLVFHNSKFDLLILMAGLRGREDKRGMLPDLTPNMWWDTQLANLVLYPERKTGLKPTAEFLWGEQDREYEVNMKKWVEKRGFRYDLAPWPLMEPYGLHDVVLTMRLLLIQLLSLQEQDIYQESDADAIIQREFALARTLTNMERRGVGWDRNLALSEAERVAVQAVEEALVVRAEMRVHRPKLAPLALAEIKDATMREFWFGEEGLGRFPVKVTPEGTPSVDKEVCEVLAKQGVPAAAAYAKLSKLESANSMWYRGWSRMAGPPLPTWHPHVPADERFPRLRTSFNQGRQIEEDQGGTISGRLAVQRWQAQAIPQPYQIPAKDFDPPLAGPRDMLRTDPGYIAIEVDLSQAEFRVAAALTGCKTMIAAFAAGLDVHDATTERMFGISKGGDGWEFKRQVSKRLGFGMIYGAGVMTIGRQIEQFTGEVVAEDSIREWVAEYKRLYPEFGRASRKLQRQAENSRRMIELQGGRMRWFSPFEQTHKAFNQKIQGSVAEVMKMAMIELDDKFPESMLLQVHDSLVFELYHAGAQGVTAGIQEALEGVFTREFGVPFRADAKLWATPDGDWDHWNKVLKGAA